MTWVFRHNQMVKLCGDAHGFLRIVLYRLKCAWLGIWVSAFPFIKLRLISGKKTVLHNRSVHFCELALPQKLGTLTL